MSWGIPGGNKRWAGGKPRPGRGEENFEFLNILCERKCVFPMQNHLKLEEKNMPAAGNIPRISNKDCTSHNQQVFDQDPPTQNLFLSATVVWLLNVPVCRKRFVKAKSDIRKHAHRWDKNAKYDSE